MNEVALHILIVSVGPDAPEPISSLTMDGDAVWAASGPHVIKYLRGKEVRFLCIADWYQSSKPVQVLRATNPLGTALSFISIFGSQLLALTENGGRMLLWNTSEAGESSS